MKDWIDNDWTAAVIKSVWDQGYFYEPEFSRETASPVPLIRTARALGTLFLPSERASDRPVLLTAPSRSAPESRPFDREASIGWHNDFTTKRGRPELSLFWIRREDPSGGMAGDWRVASVRSVLAELRRSRRGQELIARLGREAEAFGYGGGGTWSSYRVVIRARSDPGRIGMRYYGRALREGARLRYGCVPRRVAELTAQIEEAADRAGRVLRATTGALLVAHNRWALHDRLEQGVSGSVKRQAWLCFVAKVHSGLLDRVEPTQSPRLASRKALTD